MTEEKRLNRKQKAIITVVLIITVLLALLASGSCNGCIGGDEESSSIINTGEESSSTVTSEEISSNQNSDKVKLTVTIKDTSSVYGDPLESLEWSAEVESGDVSEEELQQFITISKAEGDTVGKYPIVGYCSNEKWDVTFKDGIYSITPRPIKITANDKESFVGEDLRMLTYSVEGRFVNNDKMGEIFSIETDATGKVAGKFDILIKVKNNPNYQLTVKNAVYTVKNKSQENDKPGNQEKPGENTSKPTNPEKPGENTSKPTEPEKPGDDKPEPKPENVKIIVTITNESSIYGDSIKTPKWTAKVESGKATDAELKKFISVSKTGGNTVGEYPIVGSCTNGDWNVTFKKATYTIKPRELKVTAEDKESYVGEALKKLTYKLSGSLAKGDKESDLFTLETKATSKTAGKYDILIRVKNNPNYKITIKNAVYTVKDQSPIVNPNPPTEPDKPDQSPIKPGVPSEGDENTDSGNSKPDEQETPTRPGVPSEGDESKPNDTETPSKPGTPTEGDNNEQETPTRPGTPSEPNEQETPTRPGTPSEPNEQETPTRPGTPSEPNEQETPARPGTPSEPNEQETPTRPGGSNEQETPAKPGVPSEAETEQ